MNKFIVTTTINEPTKAISNFDAMEDWTLIVTGDQQGPKQYPLKRGKYLDWEYQQKMYPDLCKLIGPRSTARGRMIAIIEAVKFGADIIATIDDDNIPHPIWGKEILLGKEYFVDYYCEDSLCFDPIGRFYMRLWHRGFPLELVDCRECIPNPARVPITPLIQANLWDGDPDVDAVLRIGFSPRISFPPRIHGFTGGRFCPMNSQNTMFLAKHAKDYCPFPFIGRAEDIWASYVFQSIHPNSAVYGGSTVLHHQDRSITSLIDDLEDELFGMRKTFAMLCTLSEFGVDEAMQKHFPKEAIKVWELYRSHLT